MTIKRIREHICHTPISHPVNGGLRGAEPPMRTRNLKSEKLMRIRQTIGMCKVCRVDSIFLHTFNYRLFAKKCEKRVYVPCTPCTSPTGACQQMRNKMLFTLHTLHVRAARPPRPEAGLRRQAGTRIVQHADFNALYSADSEF